MLGVEQSINRTNNKRNADNDKHVVLQSSPLSPIWSVYNTNMCCKISTRRVLTEVLDEMYLWDETRLNVAISIVAAWEYEFHIPWANSVISTMHIYQPQPKRMYV